MNKIFFSLVLLFVLTPAVIFATGCPRGLVNEPAPGSCGLYIDANKDGYCDLSEVEESSNYGSQLKEGGVNADNQAKNSVKQKDNKIILITIILIVAYILGLILVKNKKISVVMHRKFWNWVLLVLFVPTAVTSIFLALAIEFGIKINLGFSLSSPHLVFGWAFLLVSIFHIFWHTAYYFRSIPR